MSKISYPQLIKNIANAYREATGSSEPVAIGELTNKIRSAIGNNNTIVDSTNIALYKSDVVKVVLPVHTKQTVVDKSGNIKVETSISLESEE